MLKVAIHFILVHHTLLNNSLPVLKLASVLFQTLLTTWSNGIAHITKQFPWYLRAFTLSGCSQFSNCCRSHGLCLLGIPHKKSLVVWGRVWTWRVFNETPLSSPPVWQDLIKDGSMTNSCVLKVELYLICIKLYCNQNVNVNWWILVFIHFSYHPSLIKHCINPLTPHWIYCWEIGC